MRAFLGLEPTDAEALVDGAAGQRLSFRDVRVRAHKLAAALGEDKQALFLLARNDIFSVLTYYGAIDRGHAVALLDAGIDDAVLGELVEAYEPTWIAGPEGTGARVGGRGIGVDAAIGVEHGELVRTAFGGPPRVHPDLSLLLSTSGTTGSRKFVRLSTRSVEANAASIAARLELTATERPITSLPLHYSFGLSVLNSHWRCGAAVVLTDVGVLRRSLWATFEAERCTSLAGVPYTYQMLERVGFREMDLPTLRSLQQAGGALDRRLTLVYGEHMARRGGRLFVMYGQTEATARIATVAPERLMEKLGSAGTALPGGRLWIEGDDGRQADAGATGEVVYEGPNVMMGYASGVDDLAAGDELGGVLRTGDLGYLDQDGYLFLVGRSKRIGKVFGLRVNLDEVEAMVREQGPAAVVGGADTVWAFCAFGTEASLERLASTIAGRLRIHGSGLRFRRVDAIPTTSSGKVDYERVQGWVQ